MESPRPDALIETIHVAADGTIALWAEHAQRLAGSAIALKFAPVSSGLEDQVQAAVAALTTQLTHDPKATDAPKAHAASEHIAAKGELASSSQSQSQNKLGWRLRLLYAPNGSVSIETAVLPPLSDKPHIAWAHEHLDAVESGVLDSTEPLLRHKTSYRPWYAPATAWLADHPDVFDLLYLNERGAVCEGSRTNVYARVGGRWLTPSLEDGCLPGTVRASLLTRRLVTCATLTPADLTHAEGLRLSNGLRGWFDVAFKA